MTERRMNEEEAAVWEALREKLAETTRAEVEAGEEIPDEIFQIINGEGTVTMIDNE
jgi:hypothetical protein